MGLEIQPPGRFGIGPAVHGQGHEVRSILVVAEDGGALLTRAAPDGLQAQVAKLAAGRRRREPAPPAREPMDRAVHHPYAADEPARREPWSPLGFYGSARHVQTSKTLLTDSALIDREPPSRDEDHGVSGSRCQMRCQDRAVFFKSGWSTCVAKSAIR